MNKFIYKIILAILVSGIFLPLVDIKAAGNAVIILQSSKTDYYVGENIYIDIAIETNGEELNVARANMDFTGGNTINIDDFVIGTALPYLSPGTELDNVNNYISVGTFILMDSVDTDFIMGRLVFTANSLGSSTISIANTSHLISPAQEEKINLAGCQGITINVIEPPNNAPNFQAESNKSIMLGSSVNFQVSATDPDGDGVTLTWDIPVGATMSNVTSGVTATADFSWTPTALGSTDLIFYATDDDIADPKTSQQTVTLNVNPYVNQPANFTNVSNKSISIGDTINQHISATDPDGDGLTLTWNVPAGATVSNVTSGVTASADFSWTASAPGVYNVTFTATDDYAADPKSIDLNFQITVSIIPNDAPIITPLTEKIANVGQLLSFNVTATDPDLNNITLSLQPLDTASFSIISTGSTSTGRFDWTPTTSGIYYATFDAVDDDPWDSLSDSETVRITVFGGSCQPCAGRSCPTCDECEEQDPQEPIEIIKIVEVTEKRPLPVIESISHSDKNKWYSANTAKFSWQMEDHELLENYLIDINTQPYDEPDFGYLLDAEKNVFSFGGLDDGYMFFHLRTKYSDGWGQTVHYPVKIDITPPEFFHPFIEEVPINDSEVEYLLHFIALDKHSGINAYQLKIDNGDWQTAVNPVVLNNYPGEILKLRAIDNAGNVIEIEVDLENLYVKYDEETAYVIEDDELNDNTQTSEIGDSGIIEEIAGLEVDTDLKAPNIIKVIVSDDEENLFSKKVISIIGSAQPGVNVYVILKSDLIEKLYKLSPNNEGLWILEITEDLPSGDYVIKARVEKDSFISLFTENVYFTLKKDFEPEKNILASPDIIKLISFTIVLASWFVILKKEILSIIRSIIHYFTRF